MITNNKKISNVKIFALNSNKKLAQEIADFIGAELGAAEITRFEDGEIRINIEESVRGNDVYLIQSTNDPSNDYLMEVLIMTDALRRASARTINVVMPYYGYARQDRKPGPREAITAKVVANMLAMTGVSRMVTLDLHSPQIQGFFDIPMDHLSAIALLANYFVNHNLTGEGTVVVAPDHAGVSRAREMAELLDSPLAIIDKRSADEEMDEELNVVGEVSGCTCILFDDIMDTAKTVTKACELLTEEGAKEVYVCVTHPVLSGKAIERINSSGIKKAIVTNTIDIDQKGECPFIECISVGPLLGDAVLRIQTGESIKPLFEKQHVERLTE